MQNKKLVKRIFMVLIPVCVIAMCSLFLYWNKNTNKYNLIRRYSVDNNKDVYLLGTIGKRHFSEINNYSMAHMLGVIENLHPDLVMIQAREDHHLTYGIVDGAIDSCVAYSYCSENKIPMKFVDWWIIDNIYPKDATTNLQDDNIFIKVCRNIKEANPNSKILIITGADHFYELGARFDTAGNKRIAIEDKRKLFQCSNGKFKFPAVVAKVWRDRTYYYAYSFGMELVGTKGLDQDIIDKYNKTEHDKFYMDEIKYCKFLNNDILFK